MDQYSVDSLDKDRYYRHYTDDVLATAAAVSYYQYSLVCTS